MVTATLTSTKQTKPVVIWERLPEDFILPDEPVENIYQPLLAAALTEALDLAGYIKKQTLVASNMGITVKVSGKTVIKAPDWFYVSSVFPISGSVTRRSYTPKTEGELPTVVMEFLSDTDTGEHSIRPSYPYGKMYFYEQILQVPLYIIFDSETGLLEVRQLENENYIIQPLDAQGRYFIEAMGLYLGAWYGTRLEQTTHWLRWWDREGNLLLWGLEKIALEKQRADQEKQRANQEKQRADEEKQRADQAEQELARLRQLIAEKG